MWPAIFAIASMKAAGLNTVDSYVFWNFHVRSNATADRTAPSYSGRGNVSAGGVAGAGGAELLLMLMLTPSPSPR